MRFQTELMRLSSETKQLLVSDLHPGEDIRFITIKKEILDILEILYGEASREFRVVKLTSSPATVVKVLNHIAGRNDARTQNNIAANS